MAVKTKILSPPPHTVADLPASQAEKSIDSKEELTQVLAASVSDGSLLSVVGALFSNTSETFAEIVKAFTEAGNEFLTDFDYEYDDGWSEEKNKVNVKEAIEKAIEDNSAMTMIPMTFIGSLKAHSTDDPAWKANFLVDKNIENLSRLPEGINLSIPVLKINLNVETELGEELESGEGSDFFAILDGNANAKASGKIDLTKVSETQGAVKGIKISGLEVNADLKTVKTSGLQELLQNLMNSMFGAPADEIEVFQSGEISLTMKYTLGLSVATDIGEEGSKVKIGGLVELNPVVSLTIADAADLNPLLAAYITAMMNSMNEGEEAEPDVTQVYAALHDLGQNKPELLTVSIKASTYSDDGAKILEDVDLLNLSFKDLVGSLATSLNL